MLPPVRHPTIAGIYSRRCLHPEDEVTMFCARNQSANPSYHWIFWHGGFPRALWNRCSHSQRSSEIFPEPALWELGKNPCDCRGISRTVHWTFPASLQNSQQISLFWEFGHQRPVRIRLGPAPFFWFRNNGLWLGMVRPDFSEKHLG